MGLFDKPKPQEKAGGFTGIPPYQLKRWTKEEIKTLIQMWPDHTIEEISKEIGRSPTGIQSIVYSLKKMGLALPSKRVPTAPRLKEIIKEALEELKLPYNK